jgi:hypothetical protein
MALVPGDDGYDEMMEQINDGEVFVPVSKCY